MKGLEEYFVIVTYKRDFFEEEGHKETVKSAPFQKYPSDEAIHEELQRVKKLRGIQEIYHAQVEKRYRLAQ